MVPRLRSETWQLCARPVSRAIDECGYEFKYYATVSPGNVEAFDDWAGARFAVGRFSHWSNQVGFQLGIPRFPFRGCFQRLRRRRWFGLLLLLYMEDR